MKHFLQHFVFDIWQGNFPNFIIIIIRIIFNCCRHQRGHFCYLDRYFMNIAFFAHLQKNFNVGELGMPRQSSPNLHPKDREYKQKHQFPSIVSPPRSNQASVLPIKDYENPEGDHFHLHHLQKKNVPSRDEFGSSVFERQNSPALLFPYLPWLCAKLSNSKSLLVLQ